MSLVDCLVLLETITSLHHMSLIYFSIYLPLNFYSLIELPCEYICFIFSLGAVKLLFTNCFLK